MVKNWWRKSHIIFLSCWCFFKDFLYIFGYYLLYMNHIGHIMSILQKDSKEMVRNSWNGTVSTFLTYITVWCDVTSSGSNSIVTLIFINLPTITNSLFLFLNFILNVSLCVFQPKISGNIFMLIKKAIKLFIR